MPYYSQLNCVKLNQVKLYWLNSLACHGYLIDESWLITANGCFSDAAAATTTTTTMANQKRDNPSGWSAEISYEHYGNEDYKSIESNRRSVKDIHFSPLEYSKTTSGSVSTLKSPIVLVELDKPVRFR